MQSFTHSKDLRSRPLSIAEWWVLENAKSLFKHWPFPFNKSDNFKSYYHQNYSLMCNHFHKNEDVAIPMSKLLATKRYIKSNIG